MASLKLKTLVAPKGGAFPTLTALIEALGGNIGIEDAAGELLLGNSSSGSSRLPVCVDGATLGWVTGLPSAAATLASLLNHLAAKESERRALAAEVLHLYRE